MMYIFKFVCSEGKCAYIVAEEAYFASEILKGITSKTCFPIKEQPLDNYPGIAEIMRNRSGVYINTIDPF